jgi:alkylated DNA repair dioxygenase AlkB
LKWEQREIFLYGRTVQQPRLTCWYGDEGCEYGYSGIRLQPLSWHCELLQLRRRLEAELEHPFNSILANAYRSGQDSMGWHSDDEVELGENPVIASISLGETRRFLMRERIKKTVTEFGLESGSLLVMQGGAQSAYQHCLPKTSAAKGLRINLTFRQVLRH